jgi:3-dehydroquinate synthase
VHVALPDQPYDIVVGAGVLGVLATLVGDRRRVVVVTQPAIAEHHGAAVTEVLPTAELALIADGEAAKTITTVEQLCRAFAAAGVLRGDAVVALGGGVVGDVAGFAAAVYHRGIDVVQVPTTLLAQVDSAIGGKTGVNLPEGKNLVGAFHHPIGVVADVDTLTTLPAREYRSGLGEVAKYALIEDAVVGTTAVGDLLREHEAAVLERDPAVLTRLVEHSVAIKAHVVASDPAEQTGLRAVLNYGHTLAHALETGGGYELLHGEAVSIGLVFAGELAATLERIDRADRDHHLAVVTALGLPDRVPEPVPAARVVELMARDKKSRGGLTFVLRGRDGLTQVDDPPAPALEVALRTVGIEGGVH